MFTIIGIMLTGMLVGYLLRSKRLLWIHKVITLLIWLLLFLLGIDVGGNETIIRNLHAIGLEALDDPVCMGVYHLQPRGKGARPQLVPTHT